MARLYLFVALALMLVATQADLRPYRGGLRGLVRRDQANYYSETTEGSDDAQKPPKSHHHHHHHHGGSSNPALLQPGGAPLEVPKSPSDGGVTLPNPGSQPGTGSGTKGSGGAPGGKGNGVQPLPTTPGKCTPGPAGEISSHMPKGTFFGGVLYYREMQDKILPQCLLDNYMYITPGDELKMAATYHGDFAAGDAIVKFANDHCKPVRGHTLLWYNSKPMVNPPTSKQDLMDHITRMMTHYGPHIVSMDVVNEAFVDGGFRQSWLFDLGGEEMYKEAFHLARKLAPNVKLFVNDFGVEGGVDGANKKAKAMYDTVKRWKAEGVPVDGVGLQCHFGVDYVPTDLGATIAAFNELGVEVVLSELDVAIDRNAGQDSIDKQAKDYGFIFDACVQNNCAGITTWGITDIDSWIIDFTKGQKGRPLLFDNQCKPKKEAYAAVLAALEKPAGSGGTKQTQPKLDAASA